jgi:hypothetical protein
LHSSSTLQDKVAIANDIHDSIVICKSRSANDLTKCGRARRLLSDDPQERQMLRARGQILFGGASNNSTRLLWFAESLSGVLAGPSLAIPRNSLQQQRGAMSRRSDAKRARFCGIAMPLLAALLTLLPSAASATTLLLENFDNVSGLGAAGWVITNNSSPVGTTNWFQGNPGVFSAQSGAANSYVAANFEAAGFGGNISDWLISPVLSLHNTDVISFWSRTEAGSSFPDRLELRLSLNGASTNVGATDSSVGDFSTLLLTINPALAPGGYPENWALFQATISGLGGPTNGRFAFRYNVSDTSVNGDYIGIDTVAVTAVPEPGTLSLLTVGILAAARARRSARRRSF